MNALLAQRHRPSLGLGGALGGAVRQLLRCGVLHHSAVGYLWREVRPPVPAEEEGVMLDLLSKFDLLLPGPEPGTSFVPLLLPPALSSYLRGVRRRRWPLLTVPQGKVQSGARFLFAPRLPAGLVERLLARCIRRMDVGPEPSRTVLCWAGGMLARDERGGWSLLVRCGVRPALFTEGTVPYVDVLIRCKDRANAEDAGAGLREARRLAAPFVNAMQALLEERYHGVAAEVVLLCPRCTGGHAAKQARHAKRSASARKARRAKAKARARRTRARKARERAAREEEEDDDLRLDDQGDDGGGGGGDDDGDDSDDDDGEDEEEDVTTADETAEEDSSEFSVGEFSAMEVPRAPQECLICDELVMPYELVPPRPRPRSRSGSFADPLPSSAPTPGAAAAVANPSNGTSSRHGAVTAAMDVPLPPAAPVFIPPTPPPPPLPPPPPPADSDDDGGIGLRFAPGVEVVGVRFHPAADPSPSKVRRTDAFLSFHAGPDGDGRDNLRRVRAVNDALQRQGFSTWLGDGGVGASGGSGGASDSDVVATTTSDAAAAASASALDGAGVVVIFLSRAYLDACTTGGSSGGVGGVGGECEEGAGCRHDFEYAYLRKTLRRLVVVTMDSGCRDAAAVGGGGGWGGAVGDALGDAGGARAVLDLSADFGADGANMQHMVGALAASIRGTGGGDGGGGGSNDDGSSGADGSADGGAAAAAVANAAAAVATAALPPFLPLATPGTSGAAPLHAAGYCGGSEPDYIRGWPVIPGSVAYAKRCVVQIGIYDRDTRRLVDLGSGSLLEGGRVLTVGHLLARPDDRIPGGGTRLDSARRVALVAVFDGEAAPTRWAYRAALLTPAALVRKQMRPKGGELLDLAVLQLVGAVRCEPPCCCGFGASFDIVSETDAPPAEADAAAAAAVATAAATAAGAAAGVTAAAKAGCGGGGGQGDQGPPSCIVPQRLSAALLLPPYALPCDITYELRTGEDSVTFLGYAAAVGSHIFVSSSTVVTQEWGYCQTTAYIECGSSGGPVINKRGAIIGVISCGGVTRGMGRAQELSKARLLRGYLSREHFGE